MPDMTKTEAIEMMRREMQRKVRTQTELIARHADSAIGDLNTVKRNLQDGQTVYDFHGSQSIDAMQKAIDELRFAREMLSNLDFIVNQDQVAATAEVNQAMADKEGPAALLPTGELMNPSKPTTAMYYDEDAVGYIARKVGDVAPSRVLTSFGRSNDSWAIGTQHTIIHDQTHRDMGRYEVVGFIDFKSGQQMGQVPDRKLRHWVFK
jgi:hypothetical protein